VSGRLEFDLPEGLTVEPARPEFGPIGPGETAKVSVTFVSDKPAAGKQTVPYRIYHRVAGAEKEVRTLARAVTVTIGPTLEYVYQHPKPPVFVVHAPNFTGKFDMFNGLCRYLADDDDTVRLEDSPLFTFGDGKDVMLGPETKQAFTWPREAPADLVAEENAKCRWQAVFFGNRMMVRMDPGWTQFETTHFTVPGNWVSPGGKPRWARVVAVKDGQDVDDKPGTTLKVSAAELEFPGGKWNLAFTFEPPQQVTFNGTELKFSIGSLKGDNWQVGFCKPGELDAWRGKKK
jgi:hypothetical protein